MKRVKPSLRYMLRMTWDVIYYSNSAPLRLLMGVISCVWGPYLLCNAAVFDRPVHRLMALMVEYPAAWVERLLPFWHPSASIDAQQVWGVAFLAYGVSVLWRLYEGKPRMSLGRAVNLLGAALWALSTLGMYLALDHVTLEIIVQGVLSVQLLIIAIRTGLNDDTSSP